MNPLSDSCDNRLESAPEPNNRLTHARLWIMQFYALLVKRILYTKGKLVALTVQNIFPLVVIILSLLIAQHLQSVPDPPPLELSPQLFFAKSHYNYLFAGGYYTNETTTMIESLFHPCGVSANRLSSATNKKSKCYYDSTAMHQCPTSNYPQQQYSCSCQSCENENQSYSWGLNDGPPPCYNGTITGSRVLNLTQSFDPLYPEAGFFSLHEYILRSTYSFIEQRYGGVSFGHFKDEVVPEVDDINSKPGSLPFLATHSAAKVWYTFKGYHAMPAYLNVMNNAILRGNLGSSDDLSEYGTCSHSNLVLYNLLYFSAGITTVVHPFKLTGLKKAWYAIT